MTYPTYAVCTDKWIVNSKRKLIEQKHFWQNFFHCAKKPKLFQPKEFLFNLLHSCTQGGQGVGWWRGDGGLGAHQYPLKNFFIKMQYNLQYPPSFFATQSTPSFAKNPQWPPTCSFNYCASNCSNLNNKGCFRSLSFETIRD